MKGAQGTGQLGSWAGAGSAEGSAGGRPCMHASVMMPSWVIDSILPDAAPQVPFPPLAPAVFPPAFPAPPPPPLEHYDLDAGGNCLTLAA